MFPITYLPMAFALLTLPAPAGAPALANGTLEPWINGEMSAERTLLQERSLRTRSSPPRSPL